MPCPSTTTTFNRVSNDDLGARKEEVMNRNPSKNDINKVRIAFKKSLLKRNGELCLTVLSIASILEIPTKAAQEVCEGLIGDDSVKKRGYQISIEDGFFRMSLINKVERQDAQPVMTPARDQQEACQRQAAFLGFCNKRGR